MVCPCFRSHAIAIANSSGCAREVPSLPSLGTWNPANTAAAGFGSLAGVPRAQGVTVLKLRRSKRKVIISVAKLEIGQELARTRVPEISCVLLEEPTNLLEEEAVLAQAPDPSWLAQLTVLTASDPPEDSLDALSGRCLSQGAGFEAPIGDEEGGCVNEAMRQ